MSESFNTKTSSDIKFLRKTFSPLKKNISLAEAWGTAGIDLTKTTCAKIYYNGVESILCINTFKISAKTTLKHFYEKSKKFIDKWG